MRYIVIAIVFDVVSEGCLQQLTAVRKLYLETYKVLRTSVNWRVVS